MKKKNKSFRMANYITDKMEFKDLVKEKWNIEVQGHDMFKMVKKLKVLKPYLNKLNWKHGNLFDRISDLKKKLHDVQAKIDKDPFNKSLRQEGIQVLSDYKEAASDEEKLLRQKAKVTWLKEGDTNSAYFHKVLKSRINRSIIMSIFDEPGKRFEYNEVADQFVNHFEGFLGTSHKVTKFSKEDNMLFEKRVSSEEADYMTRDISNDEIKKALFDIEDYKAPGPGGFTSRFFKKSWEIIKDDFSAAIKEFFMSGKLLGEVNATIIALVPKSTTL
ncbi:hypothetical protein Tco_1053185 [Tanacetum coccineum]